MRSAWDDEQVRADEALWRYFRADRFVSALQSCLLHFPSAHQFTDPFEGAVAVQQNDLPPDPRYPEPNSFEKAFEQLRRLTKINCWHCAAYESDAMWKLYAADRKGVAIRTTAARLQAALQPFRLSPEYGEEKPYWGKIRYVDLHAERLQVGMERRFFYKHRAFEWEREFRVIISLRMAEEFGVRVPDNGIYVPFHPTELIESVYLGPELPGEDRKSVIDACTRTSLDERVLTSTLLGTPRYT